MRSNPRKALTVIPCGLRSPRFPRACSWPISDDGQAVLFLSRRDSQPCVTRLANHWNSMWIPAQACPALAVAQVGIPPGLMTGQAESGSKRNLPRRTNRRRPPLRRLGRKNPRPDLNSCSRSVVLRWREHSPGGSGIVGGGMVIR